MNLFEYEIPTKCEQFDILFQAPNLEIVRIISYDLECGAEFVDERDEWVVLLQGFAVIEIDGEIHTMSNGDILFIPANTPHLLKEVEPGSLWLAVHFKSGK